jgi:hypothetical protein
MKIAGRRRGIRRRRSFGAETQLPIGKQDAMMRWLNPIDSRCIVFDYTVWSQQSGVNLSDYRGRAI